MTDPMIEKLEALVKDIGPDLGMFIAQWAAQQQLGVEQEALSTLVVRRVRAKLRALISSAREEGEPSGCTCPDGYPSSNECPLHGDEVHRDPPSSASTHLCPNKHGAEHEMELVWYCETCGKRESADDRCCYHGEGDLPTVCQCVEKYIKDHTATAGTKERGKDERCWSCEERVEEIAHHWFMDHGEKFYLCNKCWDEWVRVVRGKAEEGSINHIGACKGNWECDCGLHMTEAEIVSRYTRPAPSAALLSAAWDMLHAVEAADAAGELAGNIGGELIDALRAALSSTPSPDAGLLRECRDAIKSCGCTEHGDLVARIDHAVEGIPASEVLDKMDAAEALAEQGEKP